MSLLMSIEHRSSPILNANESTKSSRLLSFQGSSFNDNKRKSSNHRDKNSTGRKVIGRSRTFVNDELYVTINIVLSLSPLATVFFRNFLLMNVVIQNLRKFMKN